MRFFQLTVVVVIALAVAGSPQPAAGQVPAVPGAQAWKSSHDRFTTPQQIVLDPAGERFFTIDMVSPDPTQATDDLDFGVIAQDSRDGTILWEGRYGHAFERWDIPKSVAVSPDGALVYVTGASETGPRCETGFCGINTDIATVAFDTATGDIVWTSRYDNGQETSLFAWSDSVSDLAVGPDGTVYVTGSGGSAAGSHPEVVTVAYDGQTGAQRWATRYSRGTWAVGFHIAVAPDGQRVFVTGSDSPTQHQTDIITLSLDAATGDLVWATNYNGTGAGSDSPGEIAVSPDGGVVFVGGDSHSGYATGTDFVAIAYDAATGAGKWVNSFAPPAFLATETVEGMALSPDGRSLYLVGVADSPPDDATGYGTGRDWQVVAHDTTTGDPRWDHRYTTIGRHYEGARDVVVSPDSTRLYVVGTGTSLPSEYKEYRTVAYDALAGNELWVSTHRDRPLRSSSATAVALHPRGHKLLVTGAEAYDDVKRFTTTIAYCTTPVSLLGQCP